MKVKRDRTFIAVLSDLDCRNILHELFIETLSEEVVKEILFACPEGEYLPENFSMGEIKIEFNQLVIYGEERA